jgi:hypothetical protein
MEALVVGVREALTDGALGLGFARGEAPGASTAEVEDLFAVMGFEAAPVFARPAGDSLPALDELLAAAGLLGTPLHVVDLTGWSATPDAALARIDSARAAGLGVTAEVRVGASGDAARWALARPGVILAGDGGTGAFARALAPLLGDGAGLADALARVTWLPALRLQDASPDFARKGRIQVGADADLVALDPATGSVRHLIVGGVLVVRNGALVPGARPGVPVRGAGWM